MHWVYENSVVKSNFKSVGRSYIFDGTLYHDISTYISCNTYTQSMTELKQSINFFVCFTKIFRPTPESFSIYGDVGITGEGDSNIQPSAYDAKALTNCAPAAMVIASQS